MRGGNMLVTGATMVLPSGSALGDLRVRDGRISEIAIGGGLELQRDLTGESTEIKIDGSGLHLLPGAIDPQVHFREPGQPEKENICSGSRAAAAGGVTAFLDMPNNKPAATTLGAIEEKLASAAQNAVTHHGFFIGATPTNLDALQTAVGTAETSRSLPGVCGIKVFMGSSTGDLLVDEQQHLEQIFAGTGGIIAVHAEDETRLNQRRQQFDGRSDVAAHAEWRDSECALIATKRAVALAKAHHHKLHILHLTSRVEADWLAKNKGELVSVEACPQHLTFDETDVEKAGTRLQMNPPIRYAEDRDALWQRLHDGTIQCIATDHAPHTLMDKAQIWPKSASGMPGVETSLPLMLTHTTTGRCSIEDVARWMSAGPADIYGMIGKGRLEVGMDADLVLVDMHTQRTIQDSDTWTRVGWTPLAGRQLTGWPMLTVVDGIPVHRRDDDGPLAGTPLVKSGETGRALAFKP
jgi:dihydroorotase